MSEDIQTNTAPNGANGTGTHTSSKRNAVASTSVNGSVAKIEFAPSFGGDVLTFDAAQIPGAEQCTGSALALVAFGGLHVIRIAYNNADDKPAAARAAIDKLLAGQWKGNLPRKAEAEPEPLLVALAEHLKITPEQVETTFLPAYASKHGLERIGDAKRKLRTHKTIAPMVARITADRAKRIAEAVRGQPKDEELSL
jgi:hypothetical protein